MTKKLFTLLLAVAASVGTMSAAITVRLDPSSCSSWSTVRLWAWTNYGRIFDAWPGQIVNQDGDGWYSYTFDASITSVSIIWNNGSDQTIDIENVTSSTCYALDNTSGKAITVTVVNCNKIGDLYYNLDATNQTAEVTYQNSDYPGWSTTITTANIPASVTYNSVTYSVTSIGAEAFFYCYLLTSVTIPNSVTSIGYRAFAWCSDLTSVTIGNSVTSIGESAFEECTGLTSVTIPNSVTSIGGGAFAVCSGLTSPVYNTHVFAYMPTSYSGAYMIPDGIESIAGSAFSGCTSLTSVTIPNSVTRIEENAFSSCTGLTSVTIPNSVTSIGSGAFSGCTGLKSVTIPNSVTSIGDGAFAGCSGLTSVTIPNSVTSIGDGAFAGCSGLTSPVYNTHVFAYMPTSYSGAYMIPDGIESIAGSAFSGCTSLTSVTIPNSVTSIGKYAFSGCSGLTSVTIPNSVTSIGHYAFNNCTSLISVTIPNSVTSIGEGAFQYCSGLTSVTIGNSVTSIRSSAFSYCTGLTSVTCFATTHPKLNSYVFEEVDKSIPLYVPAGSVSDYKSAKQWKDFTNILPIGAQPVDVTTTTVTPSETTADIAWPQVTGTATYTIEIKENGELICTLTFNAQGQLISTAFNAPSRNNAPQRAQAAGFSFTVTSLDSGTTYSYTMTAKDNNGNVLKTESGTFTTTGDAQGLDEISSSLQGGDRGRLIYHEGQIFILRGEKIYTLQGQEVR